MATSSFKRLWGLSDGEVCFSTAEIGGVQFQGYHVFLHAENIEKTVKEMILDAMAQRARPLLLAVDHHNYSNALFNIREGKEMKWSDVAASIEKGGHRYCTLQRDNWSCSGDIYIEKLLTVPAFDAVNINPRRLAQNTKIFFEGNSVLAQIMLPIVCETDPELYHVSGINSLLAYYPENRAMIFGIDNDYGLQEYPREIISLLNSTGYHPTYILLGDSNVTPREKDSLDRLRLYHEAWPEAIIIPMFRPHLREDCLAEFHNCANGVGHQCVPGPITRSAENLMKHILNEDEFAITRYGRVKIGKYYNEFVVH